LTVKGNQPALQAAIDDKVQLEYGINPDHVTIQEGHGRVMKRSIWVTSADGVDFPHSAPVAQIRRDGLGPGRPLRLQRDRARCHQLEHRPRQPRQTRSLMQ